MVKPFPVPVVDLSADTSICLNEIVQLNVGGGTEVFNYNWDRYGTIKYYNWKKSRMVSKQ